MAEIMSDEELVRELRVLHANRPLQFTKLITKYYKGERAKQMLETLKTWSSSWPSYCDPIFPIVSNRLFRKVLYSHGDLKGAAELSETAHARIDHESFCQYCGGKLHLGYHFTCHICGDSYCYIHMGRHSRAHAPRPVSERLYAR